MRKCIGFFEEDELTKKAKIQSLTSNNERVLSVLESKTFPCIPKTFPFIPVSDYVEQRDRILKVFEQSEGKDSQIYGNVLVAFRSMNKRLGLEELK